MTSEVDVEGAERLLAQHIQKLAKVQEVPMRRALTREWLDTSPPSELCWALSELLRGTMRGQPMCAAATFALSLALIDAQRGQDYALFQAMFEPAHAQQREELYFLYRDSPPQREMPEGSRLPEARLPLAREISLGERRSLAAGSNRRYLEHLLHDPNPMVITKLLKNPAMQVKDILVVASRRPTIPGLLEAILAEWRWLQHHGVREALARNPFMQTGYALKLLPTLHVQVLRQIASSRDVHRGLGEFAQLLVRLHDW
jgi:hypothetical protein